MNNKITTVIFDCFGVVCAPVLSGWYRTQSAKTGFVDLNLRAVLTQFDLGILSEDDIVEYFLKYEGVDSTKEKLRDELDAYMKLDADLMDNIKKLKQDGFKTALLSNGNHAFFERKIYPTHPEFKELFDDIVISSEVGMVKPNAGIYLLSLERIQSKAEESLFIDDRKENVDSATILGMSGFLYTDNSSFSNYLETIGIDWGD